MRRAVGARVCRVAVLLRLGHSLCCATQWKPTWDMKRSTVLYTCNNTGMHNVKHAIEYGTVVYDW